MLLLRTEARGHVNNLFALHLEQKSLEFQMGATHTIFQMIQEVSELSTCLYLRPARVAGKNIFLPRKAKKYGVHLNAFKKGLNFH